MFVRPRPCGRLLVVEDDEPMRLLIAASLEDSGFVVATASSGEAALQHIRTKPVDVVLLDVHLPGISGYEVCYQIRQQFAASIGILFVSGERTEPFDRVAGLLIGGDDYLSKPFAPDELIERTRRLIRSELHGCSRKNGLTGREAQVLRLLAEGLTQAKIADRLVISPNTVETHIEHILTKLDVHSRAEAIAAAYRHNLLDAADLPT